MRRVSAVWPVSRHSTALANRHPPVGLRGMVPVELGPGSRHFRQGFDVRWLILVRWLVLRGNCHLRSPPICQHDQNDSELGPTGPPISPVLRRRFTPSEVLLPAYRSRRTE
jgi:hypothetical protein